MILSTRVFRPLSGVSLVEFRSSLRSLARRPVFFATAVVTLALGIGATTAVFSAVNGLILQPLPYAAPDQLVAVWPRQFFANREIDALRKRSESYRAVGSWSPGWLMTLRELDMPRQVTAARVSGNLFEMLGAEALLGRPFAMDAEVPGADRVVVLSHQTWHDVYRADSSVIGRSIPLDGQSYTVIAVMPIGFELFDTKSDVWTPLTMDPDAMTWSGAMTMVYGRLAPGATVTTATAELTVLTESLRQEFGYPIDWSRGARVVGLQESLVGGVRSTLWLVLAAVGFLLLIAAVNVANLMLVRTAERRTELAVRSSLGASSRRIIGLLLGESLVIGVVGGVAGVALAFLGVELLRAILPGNLLRLGELAVDGRVLLVAGGLTLATAILFGLAPSWYATRPPLASGIRQGRGGAPSAERARGILVAVEVALAAVLLAGASLMIRTLISLNQVDPGFRKDHLLTARVQPQGDSAAGVRAFWREALARIESIPSVTSAATILHLPTSGRSWMANIEIEGEPLTPGMTPPRSAWQVVSTKYFSTAGVPITSGRAFDDGDRLGSPRVIVVNAAFASRILPGRSPVGLRIKGGNATQGEWATVVGVVGGVRHDSLNTEPAPELYAPFEQRLVWGNSLLVRTVSDPEAIAAAVRDRIWSVNRSVPVTEMRSMADLLSASLGRPRLLLILMTVFGGIGLVLGAVGIYGVVSFGVRQRQRELGIRAALGANRAAIVRLVVGSGLRFAAVGVIVGLPIALALASLVRGFLFGIGPADPVTFGAVTVVVFTVAVSACWVPARAAARTDPSVVLRE